MTDSPTIDATTNMPSSEEGTAGETAGRQSAREVPATISSGKAFSLPIDHKGNEVYIHSWAPKLSPAHPKPVLVIHDVTEDGSHYEELGQFLSQHGFATYAMDLRGHGRSGSPLGHITQFSNLIKDTLQVASWLRHLHDNQSPLLICQGIGAIIGLDFQRTHPRYVSGMILCAPTLVLHHSHPHWKRFIISTLAEITPDRRAPMSLLPRLHHFDESERATGATRFMTTLVAVTVNRPRISLAFARTLLQFVSQLPTRIRELTCRTLALVPDTSDVIDTGRTISLLQGLKGAKLELTTLPSARHNLLTEPYEERSSLFDRIGLWLAQGDA